MRIGSVFGSCGVIVPTKILLDKPSTLLYYVLTLKEAQMIKEWSYKNAVFFDEAVQAIREDLRDGERFEASLSHYADLFEIEENALRHEWNLRNEDCR
jgi:hypothetical protein